MAVAFLNTGATSMAAANWSDTTGFAAAAQLVIREGSQAIVNDLNQSASSIEFLDIQEGFSGNIGNASGSLRCDADGTAESPTTRLSRIRYNASGGNFYFSATGGNTLAHFVDRKLAKPPLFVQTIFGILGGIGASGQGRYHGQAGFLAFSDMRSRVRHGRWSLSRLFDLPRRPMAFKITERLLCKR
jgi:hypothetical protein